MAKHIADDIDEMLERYRKATDYCSSLYEQARDDILFVSKPGYQWDEKLKARRADRPCYEFPKLQSHIRQVVNEMRQTRPQGKVRGVEESDVGLAEIMNGLAMNIQSVSNADLAHDIAFESAVKGGFGVWRVTTDYERDESFDQCIYLRPVHNPFSVKFDPAATEIDRRDARFAFVEEYIPKSEFERKYPKAELRDFDGDYRQNDWLDGDKVRIAEYWQKLPEKRTLLALSNGDTVYADETDVDALASAGIQVTNERVVDGHKVVSRLTNGMEWLTEEQEFPSKFIPLIPVWGNITNIDGEDYWYGMTRPNKDMQRLHNVHRTACIEAVAKAPKAPFIVKMGWIKGLESFWKRANAEDYPYLPVNDTADGIPQRSNQAEVPTALIQLANMDDNDIKSSTGIFDPAMGANPNGSGKAIMANKMQGSVATFNYIDNLAYAIRHEYEILLDMIPRVYDTQRVVRILGQDGAEQWKQLYQQVQDPATGQITTLNDISKGRYDVTVTVGPSYASQRVEAVNAFAQLVGQVGSSFPQLGELLSYQVVKNLDLPGNEEVAESIRRVLVGQGLLQPQPDDPQPQQAQQQPNPIALAKMQRDQAEAQHKAALAQHVQAETEMVIPRANSEIERNLAIASHHQAQDAHIASNIQAQQAAIPPLPPFREPHASSIPRPTAIDVTGL